MSTDTDDVEELRRALDTARGRIAELEKQLATEAAGRQHITHLLTMSPVVLYTCKPFGDFGATYISENVFRWFGYAPHDFLSDSRFWADHVHPDDVKRVFEELPALFEQGQYSHEYRFLHKNGTYVWVHDDVSLSRDAEGNIVELVGFWHEITRQKQVELTIQRQAAALMELSTPLIPISQRVVVMPLIGLMDSQRAQQVLNTLLDGLSRTQARVAILDITGVAMMDTQVANALIRAAKAAQLIGTQVVLTGIRPEVAQILVGLGVDLGGIVTLGTLQEGISYATRALGR